MGSVVLLNKMSVDYNTVISASIYSILGAVVAGVFGFFIGKIFETADPSSVYKKHKRKKSKLD